MENPIHICGKVRCIGTDDGGKHDAWKHQQSKVRSKLRKWMSILLNPAKKAPIRELNPILFLDGVLGPENFCIGKRAILQLTFT